MKESDRIKAALSQRWSHAWQPDALLEALQCHSHITQKGPVHAPFLCLIVPWWHYEDADGWADLLCFLTVHHSELLKPFYNPPQSPHFHRSQAVSITNRCACQEKCIPFTVHRQQKYAWGSCSDSSLQLLESVSLSFSINWYGPENITSLSSMILMCMPERCKLRVLKMLQNFIMK